MSMELSPSARQTSPSPQQTPTAFTVQRTQPSPHRPPAQSMVTASPSPRAPLPPRPLRLELMQSFPPPLAQISQTTTSSTTTELSPSPRPLSQSQPRTPAEHTVPRTRPSLQVHLAQ